MVPVAASNCVFPYLPEFQFCFLYKEDVSPNGVARGLDNVWKGPQT